MIRKEEIMAGKYSILRSESRLKDVDEKIQALFDKKHVKIIKAQEEEEEKSEKTQEELIVALVELAMKNADDIKELAEKINVRIEPAESQEERLEKLTKSLEQSGFDGKIVKIGKRRKRK